MDTSVQTLTFLFLLLTVMSTISGLQEKTFKKAAFTNGTTVCAVDSPSKVVSMENISTILPVSAAAKGCIPPSALCSYECHRDQNCTSYNYNDKGNECQLFYYTPINFKISTTCEYYQTKLFDGNCRSLQDVFNTSDTPSSAIRMIREQCCSFPFSLNGFIYLTCVSRASNPEEKGCYLPQRTWIRCLPPADFTVTAHYANLNLASGVFKVQIINNWILIHQMIPSGRTLFKSSWIEYRNGFGDPTDNYWIGNEQIHQLTTAGYKKLRVEVQSLDTQKWYSAEYDSFELSSETKWYTLNVSGYFGDAGDSFNVVKYSTYISNGMKFSTFDMDNDLFVNNTCSTVGWWFNKCSSSAQTFQNKSWWGTLEITGLAPSPYVISSRMMIRSRT